VGQPSTRPPPERRQVTGKQTIQRVAVAGASLFEQAEGGLERRRVVIHP
jgi:hypothetical protein